MEEGANIHAGDAYLAYNAYIESIVVSKRIKSIGYGTLYGCIQLKEVIVEITRGWILVDERNGVEGMLPEEYMSDPKTLDSDAIVIKSYRYYLT